MTSTAQSTTGPVLSVRPRWDGFIWLLNVRLIIGLTIVTVLALGSFILPIFNTIDPSEQATYWKNLPISGEHLLGTNSLGQDTFWYLVYSVRNSLTLGFVVAIGVTFVSTIVGLSAGYIGGTFERVVMLVVDTFITIPLLPVLIILGAVIRGSSTFLTVGLVIILFGWAFQPELILADEPTTALDVVVQKEILLLLMELQVQMGNTIMLVSHDMGVHYQVTNRMLIMYAAKAAEYGESEAIFRDPLHPYTRMLINSLPTIGDDRARQGIPGTPPSLWGTLTGCRFADRCPLATEKCRSQEPEFIEHRPGQWAACHYAGTEITQSGDGQWR